MDSGVGGLTVLKEITKVLPNESYIFVGDQANLPYGQKSSEVVRALTKRIADYMLAQDVKMFVIACNT
ncbi:glutamate racemase, partial [Lentilactobacillus parabuchneri]|nr:glutamate racemase [Lentilactobacillus parabuchneri]